MRNLESDLLIFPEKEDVSTVYSTMIRAITPRPIAWVSTVSPNGKNNLAPFSYFNGVCSKPAALSISPVNKPDGSTKDTVRNIQANKEFVVNVVPYRLAKEMVATAAELAYEESEFEVAGLTPVDSQVVAPPCVAQSPIKFECSMMQIVQVGEGPFAANLIIGEIKAINVDDSVLDKKGKIDPARVDLIGRMGGRDYCRTTERFTCHD